MDESNANPLGDGIYYFIAPFGGTNALILELTEIASVPLTILWALNSEEWHPKESLTIHVIGAEMEFEGNCPTKWETFLFHLLPPQVLKLKIILIGPELGQCPTPTINLGLCNFCKGKKCEVTITHAPGLTYHEYIQEQSLNFVPPDVICAFNCKLHEKAGFKGQDSWGLTIPCLRRGGIILTTAQTEKEGKDDYERILKECPLVPKIKMTKNPFRSLRPQRTFIKGSEEYLIHRNQYINVFI
jgi:splicing suppressor protein 51